MNNDFKLTGTVIELFDVVHGHGKKGPYQSQRLLLKTQIQDRYSKVLLHLWDNMVGTLEVGDEVIAECNVEAIESRGNPGRYFNSISIHRFSHQNNG
jgi:hypothetical protein